MLFICYDISDDKLRNKFSKFLERYGYRVQYSVFEINNSQRLLNIITTKIEGTFAKKFTGSDSVLIFSANESSVLKYGNAIHRDKNLIVI